jgi:hypothetical protein
VWEPGLSKVARIRDDHFFGSGRSSAASFFCGGSTSVVQPGSGVPFLRATASEQPAGPPWLRIRSSTLLRPGRSVTGNRIASGISTFHAGRHGPSGPPPESYAPISSSFTNSVRSSSARTCIHASVSRSTRTCVSA